MNEVKIGVPDVQVPPSRPPLFFGRPLDEIATLGSGETTIQPLAHCKLCDSKGTIVELGACCKVAGFVDEDRRSDQFRLPSWWVPTVPR